jgi:hypothetical protein
VAVVVADLPQVEMAVAEMADLLALMDLAVAVAVDQETPLV